MTQAALLLKPVICVLELQEHITAWNVNNIFVKTVKDFIKDKKYHQFQSASDLIPEGKLKCKEHNEDLSFVCNTCNVVVCCSCVADSHSGHVFSKLIDIISQLKEKNTTDLCLKVKEATKNMKKMEEGLHKFDVKVEIVVKAITEEGTQIKAMVEKYIAQMISSVKD